MTVFLLSFKVWFQNRRMKDKRQRIAIAWPYAAVYSDPAFAASILQAAANSVMPYYPAPGPMMPVMPPQMPSNPFTYGYSTRYAPYPIPTSQPAQQQASTQHGMRSSSVSSPTCYSHPLLGGLSSSPYGPISIPKPLNTPPTEFQSPSSPNSTLSMSPNSDKTKYDQLDLNPSPIRQSGLLMTTSPKLSPSDQTTIIPGKPKLFKPYKSET